MKLYMIRHGESYANREGLFSLPTVSLTENGIRDAESVGRMIRGMTFDRVLVSPYLRAQETQRYAMPGVAAEIVDDLHECDCGSLEGQPMAEMRERYATLAEDTRIEDYTRYGGEDYANMRRRVRSLMDYVLSLECETVIAFSHCGLILTFFDEVMDRPGKVGRNINCRNGSINVFEYRKGKWRVDAMNITEHL